MNHYKDSHFLGGGGSNKMQSVIVSQIHADQESFLTCDLVTVYKREDVMIALDNIIPHWLLMIVVILDLRCKELL